MKNKDNPYYEVRFNRIVEKMDELDQVYSTNNDLFLFERSKELKSFNVQPSNESYYDYYYEYMGMTKKLTLHNSIINDASISDSNAKSPRRKYKKDRSQSDYGTPKKMLMRNLNMPEQPIFNDQFLNKIAKQGYVAVYSKKK